VWVHSANGVPTTYDIGYADNAPLLMYAYYLSLVFFSHLFPPFSSSLLSFPLSFYLLFLAIYIRQPNDLIKAPAPTIQDMVNAGNDGVNVLVYDGFGNLRFALFI